MIPDELVENIILRTRPQLIKGDGVSELYQCPRCQGDQKLEYHPGKRTWYCHKCGRGGRLDRQQNFVKEKKDFDDAFLNHPMEPSEYMAPYSPIKEDSKGWKFLEDQRGLSREHILDLRPHEGPEFNRVYFPFYMPYETIPIYFIGKLIYTDQRGTPAYRNPPTGAFPYGKSEVLWGLHRIRANEKNLIICEGIFDAVWMKNAIALCGKSISQQQIDLIRQLAPREVTVMLDGGVERGTMEMCKSLSKKSTFRVSYITLPDGEDPDSITKRALPKYPPIGWFIEHRETFA